ncbi:MAG: FeoB-associated Cys-rich membrane protein [Candidatus Sumerlaeia bacterium]
MIETAIVIAIVAGAGFWIARRAKKTLRAEQEQGGCGCSGGCGSNSTCKAQGDAKDHA